MQLLQLGAWGCWSQKFHFTLVHWPLLFQAPRRFRLCGRCSQGCHARAVPGSTNFVGTNAQAHLLVMSLNVAKYNLGKVNLKAMLVSSFSSYTRSGLMPLAGAPCDSYTQLLPCSLLCLRAILCLGFFPSLPPSLPLEVRAGKYSTELFSVTAPGGGRSQGGHGYLLLMLEQCLAAPTPKLIYW